MGDQTASDSDQLSTGIDQLASDRDQSAADRQHAAGVDVTLADLRGEDGRARDARAAVGEDPTGGWMC